MDVDRFNGRVAGRIQLNSAESNKYRKSTKLLFLDNALCPADAKLPNMKLQFPQSHIIAITQTMNQRVIKKDQNWLQKICAAVDYCVFRLFLFS